MEPFEESPKGKVKGLCANCKVEKGIIQVSGGYLRNQEKTQGRRK